MTAQIEVLADTAALAEHVAGWLVDKVREKQGDFRLLLSGGSTPKALYQLLASSRWADQMPWQRLLLFWGDERFVPQDHPDSNYRMVRESLLAHVPIPKENIFPMSPDGTPESSAADYQRLLRRLYRGEVINPQRALFDVVLLGLGDDGHTASLFPGVDALSERTRWVVPVVGAKPEPRITLTYPALNSTSAAAFLITGAAKHPMLERLKTRDPALPASGIDPVGSLHFFVDKAATDGQSAT